MEENNVVIFEAFKNAKQWDEEYPKFLGNAEKTFGAKTDTEEMLKRLYYAVRYLDGVSRSFFIFSMLGIKMKGKDFDRGKDYLIKWLEEIVENLKKQ